MIICVQNVDVVLAFVGLCWFQNQNQNVILFAGILFIFTRWWRCLLTICYTYIYYTYALNVLWRWWFVTWFCCWRNNWQPKIRGQLNPMRNKYWSTPRSRCEKRTGFTAYYCIANYLLLCQYTYGVRIVMYKCGCASMSGRIRRPDLQTQKLNDFVWKYLAMKLCYFVGVFRCLNDGKSNNENVGVFFVLCSCVAS